MKEQHKIHHDIAYTSSKSNDPEYKKRVKRIVRDKIDESPRFKQFLKKENLEGKFIKNLTEQLMNGSARLNCINFEQNLMGRPLSVLAWHICKEGFSFWDRKDDLWIRYRNNNYDQTPTISPDDENEILEFIRRH